MVRADEDLVAVFDSRVLGMDRFCAEYDSVVRSALEEGLWVESGGARRSLLGLVV
jgi:hypothetical protein